MRRRTEREWEWVRIYGSGKERRATTRGKNYKKYETSACLTSEDNKPDEKHDFSPYAIVKWRKKLIYRRTHSTEWQQPEKTQHTRKIGEFTRLRKTPKNKMKIHHLNNGMLWRVQRLAVMTANRRNHSPSLSSRIATPNPSISSSERRMCIHGGYFLRWDGRKRDGKKENEKKEETRWERNVRGGKFCARWGKFPQTHRKIHSLGR